MRDAKYAISQGCLSKFLFEVKLILARKRKADNFKNIFSYMPHLAFIFVC